MGKVPGRQGPRACSSRSGSRASRSRPTATACARYGLNTGDVDAVVQAAIGGQAVTQVYEGEKRFDLTVRWLRAVPRVARGDPRDHRRRRPTAAQIPLGQLADDHARGGPGDHLPRGRPALRAGEVLACAGATSRRPSTRRRATDRRRRCTLPVRHAPRVGGRDQRAERGRGAPRDHHPADAAAHRVPRLQRGQELGRHARSSSSTSRSRAPAASSRCSSPA